MQKNNKLTRSWSWLAFLFTPLWLGYNRMYLLCSVNLISYLLEILLVRILQHNEVDFNMVGVLPAISSIIFGLYGKSFKQNLENELSAKSKVLKKGWVSVFSTFLISVMVLSLFVYIICYFSIDQVLPGQHNFFSVFVLIGSASLFINYLLILLFQGIYGIIALVLTIILIGGMIFSFFLYKYTDNFLHYTSSNGKEDYFRNVPQVVEKKIDVLIDDEANYLVIDNIKQDASLAISFCEEDKGIKYYFVEYKINNLGIFKTDLCFNKANTMFLFNKFYNNDISYRDDVKWEMDKPQE